MKITVIGVLVFSFLSSAFASELKFTRYETVYEGNEINHEMVIGCVATKKACRTLALSQGFNTTRTVKDTARCPQAPKTLVCIVKH